MNQKINYGSCRQRGISLPIIMVILLLAALVTLYTANTSVKEQQVTTDQYRSEQAFNAAQAGVNAGLEKHNDFPLDDSGNPVTPDPITSSFSKGSYTVMFCDIWDDSADSLDASRMEGFLEDIDSCTHPLTGDADGFKNDRRVGVLSVGKPDDASGRRTVSVVSAPASLFNSGGFDFLPLSARGSIAVTGSLAVINRYRNITTWSGEDIDVGSAAVGTFINDDTLEPNYEVYTEEGGTLSPDDHRIAMTDEDMTPTLLNAMSASKDITGVNSDIVDNDANLINLTDEEMFQGIFSASKGAIRAYAEASGNGNIFTDIGDIMAKPKEERTGLLWLDSTSSVAINSGTVGTFDDPAFLIVDFTGAADPTLTISNESIHGLVFVFGNVMFLGSPVIKGSVIATGSVGLAHSSAGGGTIVYDPDGLVVDPEGLAGLRGIEPGTWKDWGWVAN